MTETERLKDEIRGLNGQIVTLGEVLEWYAQMGEQLGALTGADLRDAVGVAIKDNGERARKALVTVFED